MDFKLCAAVFITACCILHIGAKSVEVNNTRTPSDIVTDRTMVTDGLVDRLGLSFVRPGMKVCQPGFCCPMHLNCKLVFCVDPITGKKRGSVVVC